MDDPGVRATKTSPHEGSLSGETAMRTAQALLFFTVLCGRVSAQVTSVELRDFGDPKRVGVDALSPDDEARIIGFDLDPDGTPLAGGTVVDSRYASVGVRFSALLTS